MALFKRKPKATKNYSFKDGNITLGQQEEDFGPQNDPTASPIDKAGLVSKNRQEEGAKGWQMENEDGSSTDLGSPGQTKEAEVQNAIVERQTGVNPADQAKKKEEEVNPLDYSTSPADTQQMLADAGYNVTVDGKWGPNSMNALNNYYNDNPDVDPPFATELDQTFKDLGIDQKSYVGSTNYHINGKPVDYKRGEVSSGGEVNPLLVESVKTELPALKEGIPGLRITGGNDAYHHSDEYYARRTKRHRTRKTDPKFKNMSTLEAAEWGRKNLKASGHTDGKSMDFATSDPDAARQAFLDQGFKKVKSGGHIYYKKGNITVIDEYAGKTSGGSGGHFHWGVKGEKDHKH